MQEKDFNNLDEIYKDLISAAEEARENSYSPYSNFSVGASVLTEGGEAFLGTNIENASFGLTTCAERVAIFSAVTDGKKNFKALAVVSQGEISTSCGPCRQVMYEFYKESGNDFDVLFTNTEKEKVLISSVTKLLPNAFENNDL